MRAIPTEGILMMKFRKNVAAGFAMILMVALLSACQKPEGPMEKAGKSVDNAVDNAGKKIENAGEKIQDMAKDAKK